MANLEVLDGKPRSPWWHTMKSIMAYHEVHHGIPWRQWWHTSKSMMAYLEVHDGIPWSPWWHTLKTMMAFLEDHDGKEKRIEFINKLNYELISQNTSWKELIKERVVFPKYATRQSWTIGQGQYWRKKNLKMRWTDGPT